MRVFFTEAAFRRAALAATDAPERDPAFVIHRYSENPRLLKRALAAQFDVAPAAIDGRNVSETSLLIAPLKRAIKAFAEGLAEERARS